MPMEDMTYTMIKVGEGTGGGMLKNPIPGSPSMWVPYVDVDDLEAATNKARTLGGKGDA
jgi:predicted enzyme related to lactoylglutathione lyase